MGDDNDQPYISDDERRAALLSSSISPKGPPGWYTAPTAEVTGRDFRMQGTFQMPGTTPETRAEGAAIAGSPSPEPAPAPAGPRSYADYHRAGLAGQLSNTQAEEKTVQGLSNQPDEATALKPLTDKRTLDATYNDPNQEKYKPTLAQRIFRGVKAVGTGLAEGGVFGGLAEGLNADYKAPNRQYGIDRQKQDATVASDDSQISAAQKAYQDATARAKGVAAEQKNVATGYNDVAQGGERGENTERQAAADKEKVAHDQATEANAAETNRRDENFQQGELKNRARQVSIEAGRLALEQHIQQLKEAQGNTPGGDEGIRQPEINKAANALTSFKDGWAWNRFATDPQTKKKGAYQSPDGKIMAQNEYIDHLNKFGVDLDETLAKKKQPGLGLRYKGGPNGQEIPVQTTPPPQQQALQSDTKSDTKSDDAQLPPAYASRLKPGKITTFTNGQRWRLDAKGKPEQVKKSG